MNKGIKNKKGFTLVEILFTISIFVLIVIALTSFTRNLWVYNAQIRNGLAANDYGRSLLKKMTTEIRTASTSNTGTYTINQATGSTFTFFSDVDGDGLKERVRYFLSGTTLSRGIIKPTGSPLTYSGGETITTLATNVTNTTIFEYYDTNYDGLAGALSLPINIPLVRLVKITVTIDIDPNKPPAATTFSTQVSMRNLKDNL